MASIYHLSWSETSFSAKLLLFVKSNLQERRKIRSNDEMEKAAGYHALSSTYYSIAGTAAAHLRKPRATAIFWFPLGLWCYWRMLHLSNKAYKITGYGRMYPDQGDIRQSILRRRHLYGEAQKCILAALAKNPDKAHTRGLLRVGLADTWLHADLLEAACDEVYKALSEAEEARKYDLRQTARIYRNCADILSRVGALDNLIHAGKLRELAKELAQQSDAHDQSIKM